MKAKTYELFEQATTDEILNFITQELENSDESPFWVEKSAPFVKAILSVLVPLRDSDILFNPEGQKVQKLTPELFLAWSDFVSLKTLAFTLEKSNQANELLRTNVDEVTCKKYKTCDLEVLGEYLNSYGVDLQRENVDFPIANYNLHQGLSGVIKSVF